MRAFLTMAFLVSCTAAAGEDLNSRAHPNVFPLESQKSLRFAAAEPVAVRDEMLGDRLGSWLGVEDGHWDMFSETLFDSGSGGPTIAGTVHKGAAEIQLRWHPGE